MKNFKTQRGITLVALIITIVVLLILAAVAIGAVKNSDIIGYAKDAAGSYNQSKANEIDTITKFEEELGKYSQGVDADFAKYILGQNKTGRDIREILGQDEITGEIIFIDDKTTSENEEEILGVKLLFAPSYDPYGIPKEAYSIYVKYDNIAYKIMYNSTTYYTLPNIEEVYRPSGEEEKK